MTDHFQQISRLTDMRCICLFTIFCLTPCLHAAERIPLIRCFWYPEGQHAYNDSLKDFEGLKPKDWGDTRTIVCQGTAHKDGRDSVRIYRWRNPRTKRLFYGTELPVDLARAGYKNEQFELWVYRKQVDGTVPVYGAIRSDKTDLFLDTSKEAVDEHIKEMWKIEKARLVNLGILFYAYPYEEEKKDEEKAKDG